MVYIPPFRLPRRKLGHPRRLGRSEIYDLFWVRVILRSGMTTTQSHAAR